MSRKAGHGRRKWKFYLSISVPAEQLTRTLYSHPAFGGKWRREDVAVKPETNTAVNPFCRRCARTCRQPANVVLCDCPRFRPWPFPITPIGKEQLELFGDSSEDG